VIKLRFVTVKLSCFHGVTMACHCFGSLLL